jgi:hypothetical protein
VGGGYWISWRCPCGSPIDRHGPEEMAMAFTYTNRKGRTYHLHRRETRNGKTRYVFAREPGEGAVEGIPEGYEVRENVNGIVSLARARPRKIGEEEEQAVRSVMARIGLDDYRVEVKDDAIVVFEPDRSRPELEEIIRFLGPFGKNPRVMDVLTKGTTYSPALRFVLVDEQARDFDVERMTYTGEAGWSWPLEQGSIADLAGSFLPHLGKDSFYELA